MSKEYRGDLLTTKSPSGNILYGDKTQGEKKNENEQYKKNRLNEK